MSKSYVWVYRTSKYNTHPAVLYECTLGRSGDYAKQGETYLRKLFQLETKADEAELSLRERLEMRSIR
ncbi:hypothetical protein [Lachnoanaerobaculum umeaense]|uniref:Uncharacterized protein n=1 Tax=Lachnoanaerobaculum umeaense TaxID=617123 RepID=A0A385Q220_9FIRM